MALFISSAGLELGVSPNNGKSSPLKSCKD